MLNINIAITNKSILKPIVKKSWANFDLAMGLFERRRRPFWSMGRFDVDPELPY